MHARCGGLDPALEAVAFPGPGPQPQDNTRRLHEEHAQVTITAFGDATEQSTTTGRHLSWHQSEPGAEVASLAEEIAHADSRNGCTGDYGTNAWHGHQTLAGSVIFGQGRNLARQRLDPLVEPAPVGGQRLDDVHHAR